MARRTRFAAAAAAAAAALSIAATLLAPEARADCPGFPQCCASTCDPSCCYAASGFTDPNGCVFGASGDYCVYSDGCTDSCGTCDIPCLNMQDNDAGMPPDDGGAEDAGDEDAGASDAAPPDLGDELPPLSKANVCYVFVHGSAPSSSGPSARTRPDKFYWGGAGRDKDDPTMYQGNFIRSMLTGTNPPERFPINPVSFPEEDGMRWATVSWEGTQPYYWAALDVLQQLGSIQDEKIPTSLYFARGNDGADADVITRHQGINHCKKGDYLVLIGHSMGNLVLDFLLQNSDPSDLNYEFLRTGGLTADAPYYLKDTGEYITDSKDPRAKKFFHNEPFANAVVPWTVPKSQPPGSDTVTPPSTCPGGVCPPACFYPHTADSKFPDLSGICLGDPGTTTKSPKEILARVAYHYSLAGPLAGNPLADCACFYNLPSQATNLCKNGHKLIDTIFEVLEEKPGLSARIAATANSYIPGLGNVLLPQLRNAGKGFGLCNGATHSMMSAGPQLLRNLGGEPSRVVYLYAGTDPYVGGSVVGFAGINITLGGRPIDCFMGGLHSYCLGDGVNDFMRGLLDWVQDADLEPEVKAAFQKLDDAGLDDLGGGGPDDYPPPLNDQAVPIASAMGCTVDQWSKDAKMAPTNDGALYFPRGICKNNEKIWMYAGRNDTIMAAQHGQLTYGVDQRAAYATPQSFWTHVRNPIRALRKYKPGEPLTFGKVGSIDPLFKGFYSCFNRPPKGQFIEAACGASDPDLRVRWLGCEPECLTVDGDVTLFRDQRTMGHILGIEERYLERRNRAW